MPVNDFRRRPGADDTSGFAGLPARRREDSLGQRLALVATCRVVGAPVEPATIGRFVVGRTLGRGGQGCVHEGFDPRLERRVALKIPRYTGSTDLAFEARALARVRHPNLVTVYALEVCEGRPVVVMELVEGTPLLEWIARDEPPVGRIVDAIARIGDGLVELHRCGLTHRDVKPGNVLMDLRGQPRLVDLGLAAFSGAADGALGTPEFAAPEQLRGAPADPAADQFGLAATLRAALEAGASPARPPPGVAAALDRALHDDPGRRFRDVAAFVDALRPRRRGRTALVVVVAALGPLAAFAAARGSSARSCPRQPDTVRTEAWSDTVREATRSRFEAMPDSIGSEAFAATARGLDAYAERWAGAVTAVCASPAGERWTGPRAQCLDDAAHELASVVDDLQTLDVHTAAVGPELVASLPRPEACSDRELARLPPALEHAEAIGLRRELSVLTRRCRHGLTPDCAADLDAFDRRATDTEVDPCVWRPMLAEERALASRNRGDAGPELREALLAADACGQDGIRLEIQRILAEDAALRGDADGAEALLGAAGSILDRVERPTSLEIGVLASRASVMLALGRPHEAAAAAERALELHAGLPHPAPEERAQLYGLLSNAMHELGDATRARELQSRALDLQRAVMGPRHPSVAIDLANLAIAYEDDDPERARALNLEAADILSRGVVGHELPLAMILAHEAAYAREAGDLEAARVAVQRFSRPVRRRRSHRQPVRRRRPGGAGRSAARRRRHRGRPRDGRGGGAGARAHPRARRRDHAGRPAAAGRRDRGSRRRGPSPRAALRGTRALVGAVRRRPSPHGEAHQRGV